MSKFAVALLVVGVVAQVAIAAYISEGVAELEVPLLGRERLGLEYDRLGGLERGFDRLEGIEGIERLEGFEHLHGLGGCGALDRLEGRERPSIYVHGQRPPLQVTGPQRHVVIPAGKSIQINAAPVLVRREGNKRVDRITLKHQPTPLHLTEKIVEVQRPVVNKFFVESHREQKCSRPTEIISRSVQPSLLRNAYPERIIEKERIIREPLLGHGHLLRDEVFENEAVIG